jgi:fructose-1,6-bisphosphatase/inositol monophosphatase family enzyme
MTAKLEDTLNLPPRPIDDSPEAATTSQQIAELQSALTNSEKIDAALDEVRGMESHDGEMDDIANKALESYKDLMDLGMNVTDMAAGTIFSNAAQMLKIALDARDAKVTRKLKQVDLMLKKARVDKMANHNEEDEPDASNKSIQSFDRNEMIAMIRNATGNTR